MTITDLEPKLVFGIFDEKMCIRDRIKINNGKKTESEF